MEQILQSPNSGSLPDINLHTATGDERLTGIMLKKIENLEHKVHELETKKILNETSLPPEILAANGMLPPEPKTVQRGRGFRPLLRSEIEEAIKVSPFCSDQAKHVGVCISTY